MISLPEKISGGVLVGFLGLSGWGIHKVAVRLAEDLIVQEESTRTYIWDSTYHIIRIPKIVAHHYTPGSISLTILIGLAIIAGSFAVWKVIDHIIDDEDNSWWRKGTSYEWKDKVVVASDTKEGVSNV